MKNKLLSCLLSLTIVFGCILPTMCIQASAAGQTNAMIGIAGALEELNKAKRFIKASDPTDQYLGELNATQALVNLEGFFKSLNRELTEKTNQVSNQVICLIASAEYAISDVTLKSVEKAKQAISAVKTNHRIQYTPTGKSAVSTTLKGFKDLQNHKWAEEAILDMSVGNYKGMFGGTTQPDAQGIALFSPQNSITRAEFLTVVVRAILPEYLAAMPKLGNAAWYENAYHVASHNKLCDYALDEKILKAPIPRQEMALILANACVVKGESSSSSAKPSEIADYDKIGEKYRPSVLKAFYKGLLNGKDDKGTFDPTAVLTRAEGAMVLYRLVNVFARISPFDIQMNEDGFIMISSNDILKGFKN